MLGVYEEKKGSKIAETVQSLPRQDIIVLRAAVQCYGDIGEEKSASVKELYEETELESHACGAGKIDMK